MWVVGHVRALTMIGIDNVLFIELVVVERTEEPAHHGNG